MPKKKKRGAQHPERDAQFRYIETQKQAFLAAGEPIISVDTKKKELHWQLQKRRAGLGQEAEAVNVHDFLSESLGRVVALWHL